MVKVRLWLQNLLDVMLQTPSEGQSLVFSNGGWTNGFAEPVGTIKEFAGPTTKIPAGYLLVDGSAVSRTTYAVLYALIGTTFGPGNGTTTFNLPDRQSRVGVGVGQGTGLSLYALGQTGGEETHLLVSAEIPATPLTLTDPGHVHANTLTDPGHVHANTLSDPGHTHSYTETSVVTGTGTNSGLSALHFATTPTSSDLTGVTIFNVSQTTGVALTNVSQTTGISGTVNGGSGAHNNLQPYLAMNYIIKY